MEWTSQGQSKLATAKRYHGEAIAFYRDKKFDFCINALEKAIMIRKQVLLETNPIIIATYDLMAGAMVASGDRNAGRKLWRKVLDLQISCLGPNHVEVEETMQRLCTLAAEESDWAEHKELTARLWEIRSTSSAQRQLADFDHTLNKLKLPEKTAERVRQTNFMLPGSARGDAEAPKRTSKYLEDEWLEDLKRKVFGGKTPTAAGGATSTTSPSETKSSAGNATEGSAAIQSTPPPPSGIEPIVPPPPPPPPEGHEDDLSHLPGHPSTTAAAIGGGTNPALDGGQGELPEGSAVAQMLASPSFALPPQ